MNYYLLLLFLTINHDYLLHYHVKKKFRYLRAETAGLSAGYNGSIL